MKTTRSIILAMGVSVLPLNQALSAVLTFDDFPLMADPDYGPDNYWQLHFINNDSLVYGGVTWQLNGWYVGGDQFIPRNTADDLFGDNTETFGQAHSGHFFVFNGWGGPRYVETSGYLTGLWLAQPREGDYIVDRATNVEILALSGTNVLASVSVPLFETTPVFVDTSAFLTLRDVTGYRFEPANPITPDQGYFIADDFQFALVSLAELCPCDGPWRSHGEYVRCVQTVISSLHDGGALNREQSRRLLRQALKSDCGQRDHHE